MARKQYKEDEVLRSLSQKRDVRVDPRKKEVQTLNGRGKQYPKTNDLGNKSWGKIDYLVNYQEYRHYSVSEF